MFAASVFLQAIDFARECSEEERDGVDEEEEGRRGLVAQGRYGGKIKLIKH